MMEVKKQAVYIDQKIPTGEALDDRSASGRKRQWSRYKMENEYLSLAYADIDQHKAERLRLCATILHFLRHRDTGEQKLEGAMFCQLRLCPICSWRRSLKAQAQMLQVVQYLEQQGNAYRWIMLTLTTRNVPGEELSSQISIKCERGMLGKKALLLISNGTSVKKYGTLERVEKQLKKAGVEYAICANIHENPSKEVVMEAAGFAKENGCDFIVALGGGAVLDASVAVAAMATNPGDLWDYVNGGTGKAKPLVNPALPIVTIATSSGTGSEINCWGVISNHQTNEKIGFGDPSIVPVLAIVDP